jgi:hypothetical protein
MSVQEFKALARKHWEEWLPEKWAALKAEGKLNEALQGAALLAQDQYEHWLPQIGPEGAREIALHQFILLAPEVDGLDAEQREELAEKERQFQKNPPVSLDGGDGDPNE